MFLDPLENRPDREFLRVDWLPEFFPLQWRRYGSSGTRTRRINRRDCLAFHILQKIDVYGFRFPLSDDPLNRGYFRNALDDNRRNRFGKNADLVVRICVLEDRQM